MDNCIRVTGTGLLRLKPDLCRVTLNLHGLEAASSNALASCAASASGAALSSSKGANRSRRSCAFSLSAAP